MSNDTGTRPDPQKLLDAAVAGLEAAAPDLTDPKSLAAQLPGYELQSCIGRGGMGTVYQAVDRKLGRTVAIKVMDRELAKDPAFAERFAREARALARLNHPHILTVFDFGESDGLCWLVTEFVDGMNLRQLLQMGRLPPGEALKLLPQICEALQFAHDHGVVHRDIKPENILLDPCGRVRIADFGLARLVQREPGSPTLTQTHQALGTPHYMAPEQMSAPAQVDHRADIYSLGVIAYELLTGRLPMGLFDKPSSAAAVGPAVDEAVLKSLQSAPERRYQKVSEFQKDLAGPPRPAAPAGPARWPWFALLGLVVVAMPIGAMASWLEFGIWPSSRRAVVGALKGLAGALVVACPIAGALVLQHIRRGAADRRWLFAAVLATWIVPLGLGNAALLAIVLGERGLKMADALLLVMLLCLDGLVISWLYLAHPARMPEQERRPWPRTMVRWATVVFAVDVVVLLWIAAIRDQFNDMWRFTWVFGVPMLLLLSSVAVLGLRWWFARRSGPQTS